MSRAEPMDFQRRADVYDRRNGRWTPRQMRRYQKKLKGDWGCYPDGEDYVPSFEGLPEAERPKQYRTRRRAAARAAMLARRNATAATAAGTEAR